MEDPADGFTRTPIACRQGVTTGENPGWIASGTSARSGDVAARSNEPGREAPAAEWHEDSKTGC